MCALIIWVIFETLNKRAYVALRIWMQVIMVVVVRGRGVEAGSICG